MCRFKSKLNGKSMLTKGEPTSHPYIFDADPTHIRCHTPIWHLKPNIEYEEVILDVSANGVDFDGAFDFTFTDNLEVYRLEPLSGPCEGGTVVTQIGTGFITNEKVKVKWGNVMVEEIS